MRMSFFPALRSWKRTAPSPTPSRRISRVRKAMAPLAGMADWEVTIAFAHALGVPMDYSHPSEIMDEVAVSTPTFKGVSYARLGRIGLDPVAVQRSRRRPARRSCTPSASCAERASSC